MIGLFSGSPSNLIGLKKNTYFFGWYCNVISNNIESLLVTLGAEISEDPGSRVRIALDNVKAVGH